MANAGGASSRLSVSVDRTTTEAVVRVDGELDVEPAAELQRVAEATLTTPTERLVVNCSELEFIDSTGMRALVLIREASIEAGTTMTLEDPTPWVKQMLALTGLIELFPAVPATSSRPELRTR